MTATARTSSATVLLVSRTSLALLLTHCVSERPEFSEHGAGGTSQTQSGATSGGEQSAGTHAGGAVSNGSSASGAAAPSAAAAGGGAYGGFAGSAAAPSAAASGGGAYGGVAGAAGGVAPPIAGQAGTAGLAGSGAGASNRCYPNQAFVSLRALDELNTASNEDAPRLTPDELTIYFTRQTANGPFQVLSANRASLTAPFETAYGLQLHPDSSGPSVTANGMRLYYSSDLADPSGSPDLYVANAPFSSATSRPLSALNTSAWEYAPFVSADERELYYVVRSDGLALDQIWAARREGDDFLAPQLVAGINPVDSNNRSPVLSSDGLTLYFASDRVGTLGKMDIYVATRSNRTDPFVVAGPVTELNTSSNDQPDWVSPDECTLYFRSDRPNGAGGRDILVASRR